MGKVVDWFFQSRIGWVVLTLVAVPFWIFALWLLAKDRIDPTHANGLVALTSFVCSGIAYRISYQAKKRDFLAACMLMAAFCIDFLVRGIESSFRTYFYAIGEWLWYTVRMAPVVRIVEVTILVEIIAVVMLANSRKTPVERGYPFFAIGLVVAASLYLVTFFTITLSNLPNPLDVPLGNASAIAASHGGSD